MPFESAATTSSSPFIREGKANMYCTSSAITGGAATSKLNSKTSTLRIVDSVLPLSLCTALFLTACGSAIDKQLSSKPTASQLRDGDYQVINADNPGEKIDVKKYLVRGKYTVIEFQSEY
jgi:hypothetical protein